MAMEPYQIEHLVDTIDEDEQVIQTYNYWIYRFEGNGAYVWARAYTDVNGGVRTCHWGGAKVDHFGARALERVALI
jgi:hypothetical protein